MPLLSNRGYTSDDRAKTLLGLKKDSPFAYPYRKKKEAIGVVEEICLGIKTWPPNEFGKQLWVKLEQAESFLILGRRGCLPKGTIVKTPAGNIEIENIGKRVYSYDFTYNKIVEKDARIWSSGEKRTLKIHTDNGIIRCSGEHRWFALNDSAIMTKKAYELLTSDRLLNLSDAPIGLKAMPITKIEETEEEVEMYDMEVEGTHNFILENGIISHNSGKTFLMKNILSSLHFGGYLCAVIPDTKNEYTICNRPIQDKYLRMVNPEIAGPQTLGGVPTFSYYPLFLSIVGRGERPYGTRLCSLSPDSAEQDDWIKILGLDKFDAQKRFFEQAYLHMLDVRPPRNAIKDFLLTVCGSRDAAEKISSHVTDVSRLKIYDKIRGVFRQGYFSTDDKFYPLTREYIAEQLLKGLVVLVTENREIADKVMVDEFLAMFLRKIWYLKKNHPIIKGMRLALFHEEAWEIAPNIYEPVCKKEIMKLVRLGRSPKLYQFFNYQTLAEVPGLIKTQSKYCLFNEGLVPQHRQVVMETYDIPFDMWDNMLATPLKKQEGSGSREWVFITTGKAWRFVPYAPLVKLQQ